MSRVHVFLALAIATASCGPVGYVNQVTYRASTRVEEARAVEADKYAPYWWTRATQYLHKAREVAARADFQAANRYGRLAAEAAEQAKTDAAAAKQDPSKRPLDLSAPVAPAKEAAPVAPVKEAAPVAPAKDTP